MQNAIGPVVLLGLLVIGFALLWARHMAYRQRMSVADDALKLVLSIAAWLCIILGTLGPLLQSMSVLSPIGLVVVAGVTIMLVTRYRSLERRSLLQCLSIAAQKGVALNEAARGFANERSDELGLRAMRLAEALEAGSSFPEALARSGTRLPPDVLLAVRVGYETSTLSESLRRIARTDADLDLLIRSVFEKGLYLLWIWGAMTGVLIFLMLKIIPVFERMFFEFAVDLPSSTRLLIAASNVLAQYWFLTLPIVLPCLLGAVIGTLYYIDLLPTGAPIVSQLRRRIDAALILRVLALAVNQRWSLNKTIWMLARVYPSSPVRGRLYAAGTHINNGEDWCPSLRKAGLLRNADVAVLQAATRVGNLEWGLDEMADSTGRRLVYRLRVAISCLFPVTLFLFGLVVAFVVVSLFIPLVALIQGMV